MQKGSKHSSLLISFALVFITGLQGSFVKPVNGQQDAKPPVAFKARLNYFIPLQPLPRRIEEMNELKDMNTIDVNIRNDDSRSIRELEYEIYTVDKQSGAEVDHVRRIDKTRIKPGEVKARRSLSWKPDSLAKTCDPLSMCRIKIRVVRIQFEDGSEWKGKIEEEKDEKSLKKK